MAGVTPSSQALAAVVEPLLHDGRSSIQRAAARAVASLKIASASAALLALLNDRSQWTQTRVEALKALDGLGDPKLVEAVTTALAESDSRLRGEGLRILARLKPEEAIPSLSKVLEEGSIGERQEALSTIGQLKVKEADRLLATWLDRLLKGQVPAEIQLDLLDASAGRSSAEVQEKLARFEAARPKNDPLAAYREALVGGDAARGERIFREKAEVSCLKCHKIRGEGGEVGPELTGLIDRKDRAYLLESIVTPNAQIAEGFETQVVATTDGQVIAGIVKAQDPKSLTLITAEAKLVTIPKDEIDEQKRGESAMPSDVIQHLSKSELRDLIEFLGRLK